MRYDNFMANDSLWRTLDADYRLFKRRQRSAVPPKKAITPGWVVHCECGRWKGGHWALQDAAGKSLCKEVKK